MQHDDLTPDCGRMRNELSALVYDELAPDARAALQAHLDACAACRDELAALRDTRQLLSRWETPPAGDDPRQLARAIAAQARAAAPRRGRLVRWSALLCGAAAALLFVLGLLGTRASVADGRFELSFGLPGSRPAPDAPASWQDEMRAIADEVVTARTMGLEQSQEELYRRCSLMTQQELLRLSRAVDYAREQDRQRWDTSLQLLNREAARADVETRQAIVDLASWIPSAQTDR